MSQDSIQEPETDSPNEESDSRTQSSLYSSRRGALGSIASLAGLTLISSQSAVGASNMNQENAGNRRTRPWHSDVNANGYDLSNLGALSTAANSTSITDFAGANLSIDGDGVLNADAGGGWGDVGELVLLQSENRGSFGIQNSDSYNQDPPIRFSIPFENFSYSDIEQIYLQISTSFQEVEADGDATISFRLKDSLSESVVPGSDTGEITLSSSDDLPELFNSSKVPYNPEQNTLLTVESKASGLAEATGSFDAPGRVIVSAMSLRVWGEIQ